MPERLVDVKTGARILHTFPITISDRTAESGDDGFKVKALEAAANATLVRDKDLDSLSASMHVSRRGALEPDRDPHGVLMETRAGLDQIIRERAFLLWEEARRPDGRAEEFWIQAEHQRRCERAYALWERTGCPKDKAEEHWFRTLDFERNY